MQQLYPILKFGIGPAIENGFYYDVDPGEGVVLTDKDLEIVEKKMLELAVRRRNSAGLTLASKRLWIILIQFTRLIKWS